MAILITDNAPLHGNEHKADAILPFLVFIISQYVIFWNIGFLFKTSFLEIMIIFARIIYVQNKKEDFLNCTPGIVVSSYMT